MNYWWVNQKQTYRHEVSGGYLWSPKKQADGKPHFSYEFMKYVRPGDLIFSYANAQIIAIGFAGTHCYSFPKPDEFGATGTGWQSEGWRIDVHFKKIPQPLRTMDHINVLRPYLPASKSPIRHDTGGGNQAYLFEIDKSFALAIAHLISKETVALVNGNFIAENVEMKDTDRALVDQWEQRIELDIKQSTVLTSTEKDMLVKARIGQGRYRAKLLEKESRCRITDVDKPEHLIASHIKPWRSASNDERLDPENGFLFTPTVDHLFDRGFISFENSGEIILADVADRPSLERMGVIGKGSKATIGALSEGQKNYLQWHRSDLLLR